VPAFHRACVDRRGEPTASRRDCAW